jgi:CheY-like chemotaxis protein
MGELEKIEAYLSSVRHDLRSQLMVVREGASMILDGIGNENCDNCFTLLKPALESSDELNKLIGELISTPRFNAMLVPLLSVKEEEIKKIKKELLGKEEELRGLREEMRSIKKELLNKEEELRNAGKGPLENDMEVLKYELMGMISHIIRTPLAIVKESLSLMLDEIPGKLNTKQRDLLKTGKENIDNLIQSIEGVFQKSWDGIIRSSRKNFPDDVVTKKGGATLKKRILIVEDQAFIVNMLKMRLEANNYEVITAVDGQEGLEKSQKENPSLIILDVMLPKISGYRICQLLKADPKYNTIPIIISSGRTPQEIRKVSQEIGADAWVSKPFEAEALLLKIKELLEKRGK